MRLRISHRTTYAYKTLAKSIIQILRLTEIAAAEVVGIVITDAIPANSAYANCGGATCSQAGGIVTRVDREIPGRTPDEIGATLDVAGGVLDADDVPHLRQAHDGLDLHVTAVARAVDSVRL